MKNKLSARLGYTLDSTSKPTESEAESFIHEAIKKVVNMLPAKIVEGLIDTKTLVLSGSVGALPADYNKFVSMYNTTNNRDVDLLPPSKTASVVTGKDSILLPDSCAVRIGLNFHFIGVAQTDTVVLVYQRVYDPSLIGVIDGKLEGSVLAYATYLCKVQDEELNDSQIAFQDFATELKALGMDMEVRSNDEKRS